MIGDVQLLSASSVNTFLRCAKQWEFAYIYRYKMPPTLRQIVGIAAHEAVEVNYSQKVETFEDLPIGDVTDAFVTAYDRSLAQGDVIVEEEAKETPGQAKDSGIRVVEVYQERVAAVTQPLLVEQPVQFNVGDIPYSGVVDLVDSNERVRDLKTSQRKPAPGSTDYAINMTGYALGYRQLTGKTETEVVLDYIVRTKEPYHHIVVSDGPVPEKAVNSFITILEKVSAAIAAGIFLPTGLQSHACGWCGYRTLCPYVKDE